MTVDELFDTVLAMVCDHEFDPDTSILPWLTHQAVAHPGQVAEVVMRLASCCPLDEADRAANQYAVLRERGMAGAIPRPCAECGGLMVNRQYQRPDLLVHNARELCRTCYTRVWKASAA